MDLISRQDVIDAVIKYCTKYDLRELLADIEVLPSVEQVQATLDDVSNAYENGYKQGKFEAQQWISCSERLPKPYESVLVCSDIGNIEISHGDVFDSTGEFEWFPSGWKFGDVVAWMPLPKPYTEKRGD